MLTSFAITERYLTICCSLLVHDVASNEKRLQIRCRRVLQKVVTAQSMPVWRRVVRFEHDNIARGGRVKRRLTTEAGYTELAEDEEPCALALKESVFVKFGSLWDLLGYAMQHADESRWLALAGVLVRVMQLDIQAQKQLKKDLAKTILAVALTQEGKAGRAVRKAISSVFNLRSATERDPSDGVLEAIALLSQFARLVRVFPE